jgi:hypothetical protein
VFTAPEIASYIVQVQGLPAKELERVKTRVKSLYVAGLIQPVRTEREESNHAYDFHKIEAAKAVVFSSLMDFGLVKADLFKVLAWMNSADILAQASSEPNEEVDLFTNFQIALARVARGLDSEFYITSTFGHVRATSKLAPHAPHICVKLNALLGALVQMDV